MGMGCICLFRVTKTERNNKKQKSIWNKVKTNRWRQVESGSSVWPRRDSWLPQSISIAIRIRSRWMFWLHNLCRRSVHIDARHVQAETAAKPIEHNYRHQVVVIGIHSVKIHEITNGRADHHPIAPIAQQRIAAYNQINFAPSPYSIYVRGRVRVTSIYTNPHNYLLNYFVYNVIYMQHAHNTQAERRGRGKGNTKAKRSKAQLCSENNETERLRNCAGTRAPCLVYTHALLSTKRPVQPFHSMPCM